MWLLLSDNHPYRDASTWRQYDRYFFYAEHRVFFIYVWLFILPQFATNAWYQRSKLVCFPRKTVIHLPFSFVSLWPESRTCLFAYYTTPLSLSCRLVRTFWTYKLFIMYILSVVSLRLCTLSQSFLEFEELWVFSLTVSIFMSVWIFVLDLIKSEIWIMYHHFRIM